VLIGLCESVMAMDAAGAGQTDSDVFVLSIMRNVGGAIFVNVITALQRGGWEYDGRLLHGRPLAIGDGLCTAPVATKKFTRRTACMRAIEGVAGPDQYRASRADVTKLPI